MVTAGDEVLKDALARIERDLDRMDRKFDGYLTQHGQKHDVEQQSYNSHLLAASESMARSGRNEVDLKLIDTRIETIELWRHELLGSMKLVKFALGTSVLSAVTAIAALIRLFTS